MELEGKAAIITGASSGIGRAIARSLAAEGADVVLASRNEAELRDLAASLPSSVTALVVPTDVREEADVRRMVDQTLSRFGRIDVLVNNAGFGLFKPITDITVGEFDAILGVNLRGAFLCMKYVLPHMYKRECGTVVTVSSVAGKHGFVGGSAYCSSKFGLMGLSESVFQEARQRNVRVVTICPGSVDTAFFDHAQTAAPAPEGILKPEDVAETVLLAIQLPERALLRELDIRPTNPRR